MSKTYQIDQIQEIQIMDMVYGFDHIRVIFLEKLKTVKLVEYASKYFSFIMQLW